MVNKHQLDSRQSRGILDSLITLETGVVKNEGTRIAQVLLNILCIY